jgi:hypothetical protein
MARLSQLFHKEEMERDLDAELASHLEMHIVDNLRAGMTPQEARREALMKLGGVEQTKENYRERRGLPWLETFAQDTSECECCASRLHRSGADSGLGIGATTQIFSVVYGVLPGRSIPSRSKSCGSGKEAQSAREWTSRPRFRRCAIDESLTAGFGGIRRRHSFGG